MSFDTLAPHYRWLETALAGSVLQRARVRHIQKLDNAQNVLLVGEGPGRFLRALRARRPRVPITVLDSSTGMLRQARRGDPIGPTTFLHVDLRDWKPTPKTFDGIVTSCVLDCFSAASLSTVVEKLSYAATATADWLQIDFTIPRHGWQRWRARRAHSLMYQSFRLATQLEARHLTPPDPLLKTTGFNLISRATFNHGLLLSDHWQRNAARAEQSSA